MATSYRVGIDIGGTFTDIVLLGSDGALHVHKTLTTPGDFGRGIAEGLGKLLAALSIAPGAIDRVIHATTVATNAILEHKGARTGLVTTRGFRDVLEMRRLRIPEMYALNYPRPEPLVPRRLRLEVDERVGPDGAVRIALDRASVAAAADRLAAAEVEAVAVCFIHSYANPAHERDAAAILAERLPGVFVCTSSDILPVIREYERTSTTVINAFLGPTLRRYFESFRRHLESIGVAAPIQIMKSDGGIMTLAAAAERPAYIVESGPAAGVIGAAALAKAMGAGDGISFDMGGTTAKVSIVEKGEAAKTGDYEVGAGINLSSKLVMGGGYALKLPVIDVSEVGAGGGSLVTIDGGGLLRVGPQSAGSSPGPVAYDKGGTVPTFTDAALALGYLSPVAIAGGGLKLAPEKSRAALEAQIAGPLGKALLDAAYGVFQVACGTMVRAVKAVSTYRGRDPRDFALYGFGGNGPLVAAEIAGLLEMKRIVIPPHPGVFSAYGLLLSRVEHELIQAYFAPLAGAGADAAAVGSRLARLEADLAARMETEGFAPGDYEILRVADLRYTGQAHELTVAMEYRDGAPDLDALARAFGAEHERTYGHQAEAEAVECVALRVLGRVAADTAVLGAVARSVRAAAASPAGRRRAAFFGPRHGLVETPIIGRGELGAAGRAGPLIVEEYDSTCVVPPDWSAALDDSGNIVLTAEAS